MNYIIGIAIATFSLFAALNHLNQGPERYWDFVAFAVVLGGTAAVAVITLPFTQYKQMFSYFKKLMFSIQPNRQKFIEKSLELISAFKNGNKIHGLNLKRPEERILADGFELLSLGIEMDKVQAMLQERIHQHLSVADRISGSIRSLAKYPPAFGLTGTVLGLVELMRGVSLGLPAKETGIKMAIALVATLYGLLISNLFLNPAGEQIHKISEDEGKLCEIAMQAILLAGSNSSLLESQEMLNSMVSHNERVNFISNHSVSEEAA